MELCDETCIVVFYSFRWVRFAFSLLLLPTPLASLRVSLYAPSAPRFYVALSTHTCPYTIDNPPARSRRLGPAARGLLFGSRFRAGGGDDDDPT